MDLSALTVPAVAHTVFVQVLDSPFSKLTKLIVEFGSSYHMPSALGRAMLPLVSKAMQAHGGDINEVSPVDMVAASSVPALFGECCGGLQHACAVR